MKKGVIFDAYGTLLYMKRTHHLSESLLAKKNPEKNRKILTNNFNSNADILDVIDPDKEIDRSEFEKKVMAEVESVKVFPEVWEVISELESQGMIVGVISNLMTPYKKPLHKLGILQKIQYCIFSCNTGSMKPDREIYEMMLENMDLYAEEVLMVGDTMECDVIGPQAVGINGLLLDRRGDKQLSEKIANLREIFPFLKN